MKFVLAAILGVFSSLAQGAVLQKHVLEALENSCSQDWCQRVDYRFHEVRCFKELKLCEVNFKVDDLWKTEQRNLKIKDPTIKGTWNLQGTVEFYNSCTIHGFETLDSTLDGFKDLNSDFQMKMNSCIVAFENMRSA